MKKDTSLQFPDLYSKPFLKWAGGKTQLIPFIEASLPKIFDESDITFIEPFAGSGAVLFWILNKFPNITKAVINDVNKDLTDTYASIKNAPEDLIKSLKALETEYKSLSDETIKKSFFLKQREIFNTRNELMDIVAKSALLIFLNRTCFNGLYRVNSKNLFNVPFGKYANPKICDEQTILADSSLLQKVTILSGDFEATAEHAGENTFFYFDPPYRPLNKTASFNSYASGSFDDEAQKRLARFCEHLHAHGYYWLLSNSDPKNENPDDTFFDDLYSSFSIKRVPAKRLINSDASKRGNIKELLITNY